MVMPMVMGVAGLLQVLLKGGECLLCPSDIIGLQRTLQGWDILTDRTALPCLLGACNARNIWTRRAVFLEYSKRFLRPLEIASLGSVSKVEIVIFIPPVQRHSG